MGGRILEAWARSVAEAPGAEAVVEAATGLSRTRREVDVAAGERLLELVGAGPVEGRRVVLAEPDGAAWLAWWLALVRAGAVPVAVEPGERVERLAGPGGLCEALGAVACIAGGRWVSAPAGARRPRRRRGVLLTKLTSGSTGVPRALDFTEEQMVADAEQVCTGMGIGSRDRNLAVIPFGHSYGLGSVVLPLLLRGVAVVVTGAPLPGVVAGACSAHRATVFPAVPAVLRALEASAVEAAELSSLRLVVSAGAPLGPDAARAFRDRFGRCVHGFYGSTETGGIAFDATGEATLEGRGVGRPLPGVELRWVTRRVFEVRSAAVLGGGVARPPDFGRLNGHGELELLGRRGRVLKVAGRRLHPGEVEVALRAIPGVEEAWVGPDPRSPDRIAAVVAASVAESVVRAGARERLAAWKVPDRLRVVRAVPLTPRGKVDRVRIVELLGAGGS